MPPPAKDKMDPIPPAVPKLADGGFIEIPLLTLPVPEHEFWCGEGVKAGEPDITVADPLAAVEAG